MSRWPGAIAFLLLLTLASPAAAQDSDVPYWASIRAEIVNMRVGPGTSYRIEWVYRRQQLPLKVLRRKEGWRLVEDPDGTRGWMVGRFLSRDRGAIVTGEELADMRKEPDGAARLLFRLEPGVVTRLRDCENGWCLVEIKGHKGFVREDRLWGAGEP
jgi:SH3-like domain-containing protein